MPSEVWERAERKEGVGAADVFMFLWSFICVGLTAFPPVDSSKSSMLEIPVSNLVI
jgi:hypothetical protein